jgi:hypothetical protein
MEPSRAGSEAASTLVVPRERPDPAAPPSPVPPPPGLKPGA